MQNITLAEKRVIFRVLNMIMKADYIINTAETEYLDTIFKTFNLDLSEFDHMEEIELNELLDSYSTFPLETKEYARKLFIKMSECDGYVDPRELEIINKFT